MSLMKWGPLKRLVSIRPSPKKGWVIGAGVLCLLVLIAFYFFILPYKPIPHMEGREEPTSPAEGEGRPPEPRLQVTEGEIRQRSTFSACLAEKKISQQWIELIITKLTPLLNFRKLKGGKFFFITDEKGEMVRFIYEGGPVEIYEIEREPQGYQARKKEIPLDTYLAKVEGEIRSSLFEAVDAIGEKDQLVISFAEILGSEIDFYKDVRKGDRFQVVVEKVYKEKEFIRYGGLHAVEYQRGEKIIRGVFFEGDFYNEIGNSLKKAFLKVPLRFNRISSKFTGARKHPILGGVLPHYGVDYAAPMGTPVWAVADGTVVSCGWGGGFGKQVILRHPNGYMTYYGHLSSYGPGIRKGGRVTQKQVIGYVGSTGLSTGPHLDYRMAKNGKFINPMRESFPAGLPLAREKIGAFQKKRDEMIERLQRSPSGLERVDGGEKMLQGKKI